MLLVDYIDILIAALIGFLALFQLPRALVRLRKRSEWSQGHFFQYKARNSQELSGSSHESGAIPTKEHLSSDPVSAATSEAHAFNNHGDRRQLLKMAEATQPSYPPHMPTYPAFLRPFAEYLSLSIVPGYSNWQALVMLAYLGILLYVFSYHSNFLKNPRRSGMIAASQLPFLYAFASKNNVPGSLLGIGYQGLNYFHRYIGCLVVLAVNVHAIGWFYQFTTLGTIATEFKDPANRWGLVTLICMDIIFAFSTPILHAHYPQTLPFIIAVSVVYLLDRVLCLLKTRLVTATISPLSAFSATRVEIPSLNHGWRAGQHVRIRVLSSSLGWFGWMEPHPFTIASAPVDSNIDLIEEQGLVLICKKAGGWTSKLFDMAKAPPVDSGATLTNRTVKILIEGPYGGPGHAIFASYSAVVMIIGGSGITFALSTIQDLVQKGLRGDSRVKVIELVWMVQSPGSCLSSLVKSCPLRSGVIADTIAPLLPLLTSLMNSCSYLNISIHYTRPYTPQMEQKSGSSGSTSGPDRSQADPSEHRIVKYAGRPGQRHLVSMMEQAISRVTTGVSDATRSSAQDIPSGMLVGVCGPQGISKDVVSAVSSVNSKMKAQIGGVEVHLETFGF
ncbi:hypothetical protein F5887DRAFT_1172715 [Amanita rubescens]|nr:hypothetical protein F5887DRAFT_1172715 [Amanita rubescens]